MKNTFFVWIATLLVSVPGLAETPIGGGHSSQGEAPVHKFRVRCNIVSSKDRCKNWIKTRLEDVGCTVESLSDCVRKTMRENSCVVNSKNCMRAKREGTKKTSCEMGKKTKVAFTGVHMGIEPEGWKYGQLLVTLPNHSPWNHVCVLPAPQHGGIDETLHTDPASN